MKIADLDQETRNLVYVAKLVSRKATRERISRLRSVVKVFDEKHADERAENLSRVLAQFIAEDQAAQKDTK